MVALTKSYLWQKNLAELRGPSIKWKGFRDAVNSCGFQDLGFFGLEFTWCNLQEGNNRVYLILDRAFANPEWLNMFEDIKVHHLVESTSDHCILRIIDSCSSLPSCKCRFHFESLWAKKEVAERLLKLPGIAVVPPTPLKGLLLISANVQQNYLYGTRRWSAISLRGFRRRGKL